MNPIPSESQWRSVPWCLDIPYAYEHFFGKSVAEAQTLFEQDALYYQEDLIFMPATCFGYYFAAYLNYLLSEQSKGDSDGASCFFGLIETRHADICQFAPESIERTKTVLHKLTHEQAWYDADPEIYGDFAQKAVHASDLLTKS